MPFQGMRRPVPRGVTRPTDAVDVEGVMVPKDAGECATDEL
jgi:hypothetical protein